MILRCFTHTHSRTSIILCILGFLLLLFYSSLQQRVLHRSHKEPERTDMTDHVLMKLIDKDLIKILEWHPIYAEQLNMIGQKPFYDNNCEFKNCYINNIASHKPSVYKHYDAVIFSDYDTTLRSHKPHFLPQMRYKHQKFVFFANQPTSTFWNSGMGVTNSIFDSYFNYTWTYRLDSNFVWRYIAVQDLNGVDIGPTPNVVWEKSLGHIDDMLISTLKGKSKAVAWLRANCEDWYEVDQYQKYKHRKVMNALKFYNLTLDVFDETNIKMHRDEILQKYHFIFFANELCIDNIDYVTDSPLLAFNNYAVPVLCAGANYNRFLPPNSYLDLKLLGDNETAYLIHESILNLTLYQNFFRWRNNYRLTRGTSGICELCKELNDKSGAERRVTDFRSWWNKKP